MHPFLAAALASAVLSQAASLASPPIVQPGAPGQAGRVLTPEQSAALSRTRVTETDVRFMQHMLVHHAQAVEMVELARLHGSDPGLRRLAERMGEGQAAEMLIMREWLASRGRDMTAGGPEAHQGHGRHGSTEAHMPGMLSPDEMRSLAAARGGEFDRLFLQGMILHHQGALAMVDDLMADARSAEDPVLSELANSIVADQAAEILRMQLMLSNLTVPVEDRS